MRPRDWTCFALLRNVGATQVAGVTYVLPIIGISLGVLLLREQLTWVMVLGLVSILGGLVVINGVPFAGVRGGTRRAMVD